VAEDHPWHGRDTIEVRELRGERLLVAPRGWLSRTQLEAAALAAGVELDVAYESGTAATLVALAAAGAGIVVIADDAGAPVTSEWPRLTFGRRVLSTPVQIFWLPDRSMLPATQALLDVIAAAPG
jgi:DNA-binding transcriptional LysR family regulator